MATTFRQRLISAREEIDWSQTQLGEEVGAAQSTVASWEREKKPNEPDLQMIRRLATKLNKSPEWLAFGTGTDVSADMVTLLEVDARAISGPGGMGEVLDSDRDAVTNKYYWPRAEFKRAFGVDGERVRLHNVIGDSMVTTLNPGEKVIVDVTDLIPSPPGIFVLWDGLGLVLKRVEFIAQSDPPKVRISSDNSRYQPYERLVGEAYIQGRVIGSWQRR